MLVNDLEPESEPEADMPLLLVQMWALLRAMHASNLNARLINGGYELSLEVPIALAQEYQPEPHKVNFKEVGNVNYV